MNLTIFFNWKKQANLKYNKNLERKKLMRKQITTGNKKKYFSK